MAKEILVTDIITEQMIQAGNSLITKLDSIGADIKSAFWLYLPDEKTWQLIIASPDIDNDGPRNFYKKIMLINKETNDEYIIPLDNISATELSNKIVQLLKTAVSTKENTEGIRFSRNTIKGHFIDDAYIYRSVS